jgi:hypothetical protein
MSTATHIAIGAAAVASVWVSQVLGHNSAFGNLLNALWMLAPYLVLIAVVLIGERRRSLQSTAIATLLGAVGALTPILAMQLVDSAVAARLVPVYQAGVAVLLVPICRWVISQAGVPPIES